jgi:nucleoid DNA-binding protein
VTTTKSDLANAVAEANGFPLNKSVEIIEILLELIKAKLAAGEDICIQKSRIFNTLYACLLSRLLILH